MIWEGEDARVAPFIDSICDAFRKLPGNEGLRIVRTHYQPEDLRQQFITASIAGSPPDLLMDASDTVGPYSTAGFILPAGGLFSMDRYNKLAVQVVTIQGKIWGVPISNGNHLMLYYNKALVPRAPRTTQELFHYCETEAPRRGLRYCMAVNRGEPFWLMPWLGAFGGWPLDGRSPTLDTPAMREALAFNVALAAKRFVPMECDYNCMDSLFKESKVAFIINGDWALSTYQSYFGAKFGVAKIPRLTQTGLWPTPMIGGKYFMLSSKLKGKQLQLARRFVEFYTNEHNQLEQVRVLKRLPALKSAALSPLVRNDPILKVSMAQILVGKPMPAVTEMRVVWDAMRPFLGQVIQGELTPAQAARKMQADAIQKIREMDN
ncbi:MAG: extracellular solute-binding protein [Elusimicrobia bacterium]|nr:extracellular solute-binding protein [Elusimicrobiota bacterium]MDE2425364.1 extracellular solute-binding protein [Elusimicrobiota bacterium]